MWPLDSAKTDSLCAIRSRSSELSVRHQASTPYGSVSITGHIPLGGSQELQQVRELLEDHAGPVRAQLVGLSDPFPPDDAAEFPGPTGGHAGQPVLEDGG